ncbi:histone acetyltransferase type B catalytic subunit [Gorgonomyces haynaldii]|nr:histone acetyltransferase type B catalytic subunit [Gorgonomyces haynaldii]
MEKLKEWLCSTNKALTLSLYTSQGSVEFQPEYTYQVFDDEQILGYKDLKIKLCYSSGSLVCFLGLNYSQTAPFMKPLDPVKQLQKYLPQVTFNLQEFKSQVQKDEFSFKPMGELVHSTGDYEIYRCTFETPRFKEYHRRMQVFLLWFIEGASFIEETDDNWQILLLFKKVRIGQKQRFDIVGYTTYYPFYHYPDKWRMRISQFMILPPYQRQGCGKLLYNYVVSVFLNDDTVYDMTVEDPNDAFQDMRDRQDLQQLLQGNCLSGVDVKRFSRKDLLDIQTRFKLGNRQSVRMAEILLLYRLPKYDPKKYKEYRLFVKQRLYNKNREVLKEMEFGDRLAALQHTFDAVEEDYRAVLKSIQ